MDLGAALVGQTILYCWLTDGWQRSTVARLCPNGAFSHVVAYSRQTSALCCTADSLLDASSYCIGWVLLSPAAVAGVSRDPPAGPLWRPLLPSESPPLSVTFSLVSGP